MTDVERNMLKYLAEQNGKATFYQVAWLLGVDDPLLNWLVIITLFVNRGGG